MTNIEQDVSPLPGAKNINVRVEDVYVHLYIDLKTSFGPSSSGKTIIVATTAGNRAMGNTGAFLGLNCFHRLNTEISISKVRQAIEKGVRSMKGISVSLEGDSILKCVIDMRGDYGMSSSGASHVIATTSGNVAFGSSGLSLGMNCYYAESTNYDISKLSSLRDPGAQHHNIRVSVHSDEPTCVDLFIDLKKEGKARKSGKGYLLASTSNTGWVLDALNGASLAVLASIPDKHVTLSKTNSCATGATLSVGSNITAELMEDKILSVKIPINGDLKTSSTGKSVILATSGGGRIVPGTNVKLGINVYRKVQTNPSEDGSNSESQERVVLPSEEEVSVALQKILRQKGEDASKLPLKALYHEIAQVLAYPGDARDLRRLIKEALLKLSS